MDPVLLVLTCILCVVAFYLVFLERRRDKDPSQEEEGQGNSNRRHAARRNRQQRAPVRVFPLMTQSDFESLSESNDDDSTETSSDEKATIEPSKKKIGTKKAQKIAEKERRKDERETEERRREVQRKKEDEEIRKRKEADMKETAAKTAQAAAEEKQKLEQEMREQAEYERFKATFSIEGEGVGVQQLDEDAEDQLNREFVESIKEAKLISLERLCVKFDMKTDVCVEKIKSLISSGALSGVLDDRGKFLYLESSEYEKIAKFIELRGRVTLRELVEYGNKVIKARL